MLAPTVSLCIALAPPAIADVDAPTLRLASAWRLGLGDAAGPLPKTDGVGGPSSGRPFLRLSGEVLGGAVAGGLGLVAVQGVAALAASRPSLCLLQLGCWGEVVAGLLGAGLAAGAGSWGIGTLAGHRGNLAMSLGFGIVGAGTAGLLGTFGWVLASVLSGASGGGTLGGFGLLVGAVLVFTGILATIGYEVSAEWEEMSLNLRNRPNRDGLIMVARGPAFPAGSFAGVGR